MKIQTSRQFLSRLAARRFARALRVASSTTISLLLLGIGTAKAANIYWDGVTGVWSTAANWSTASGATTPDPAAPPGASDIAIFNISTVTAGSVTSLNGNQAALGLIFNNTIASGATTASVRASAAGQILSLGSSGIQQNLIGGQVDLGGNGATAMVVSLMASQSWTMAAVENATFQINSGSTATTQSITNGTSGAVVLTLDGAGTGGRNFFGAIDDGTLLGTTALFVSQSGTTFGPVKLFGTNLYSGGTTFNQGYNLELDNASALGTGALTIQGSVLSNTVLRNISTSVVGGLTLSTNNAQNWNADFTLNGAQSLNFGTGAVTVSGARTINLPGSSSSINFTEGGAIGGSGASLTVTSVPSGGGTATLIGSQLILNGANTYSGGTTINSGLLRFGTGALPSTGTVTLNGGALAVGTGTAYTTLASATTGPLAVTQTKGAFALVSDSNEAFTELNAGISLGAALGSVVKYTGALTPFSNVYNLGGGGGTIVFTNNGAFSGATSLTTGTAGTANGGGGTVIITGQNTNTGAVTIAVGTLQVSSIGNSTSTSSNLGAPTTGANGTISIGGGGGLYSELRYTGPGETTDRTLSHAGGSGSQFYLDASGSGAIVFNGAFASPSSNSTNRTINLRGIDADANTITAGIGTQAFNPAGFNLTKSQRGNWTLSGSNNFAGNGTTPLTINGGTLTADYATNASVLGGTPALTLGGGTLSIKGKSSGTTAQTLGNLSLTANTGVSQITVNGNGGTSTTLTLGNTITRNGGSYLNINLVGTGALASTPTVINNGVILGVTGAGTAGAAPVTVTDSAGTDFATQNGANLGKLGATTELVTTGSLTTNYKLSTSPTLSTATSVDTLRIDAAGGTLTRNDNSITFNKGTLVMTGAGGYTINTTTATNGLTVSGANLVIDQYAAGALTINSAITSGGGSVTKTGPGLLVAGAAQAYSGATNIYGGVLRITTAVNASSNIALNTGGILELGFANFTGTVGTSGGQVQWQNGDGGFSAFGANRTVSLTNALSAAGGQLVWGSASGNNFVTAPNASPGFVKDGFALLLSSSTSDSTLDFQNPIDFVNLPRSVVVGDGTATVDAVLSGVLSSSDYSGGLEKSGAGTLAVTAANTYTGETRILAGTLQIGNGGTTGSLSPSSPIINNGVLAFNRTNALTQGTDFAGVISGTGAVIHTGTGTTTLNGSNTYGGVTNVNAGTLLINNTAGSGTGSGTVRANSGGTLGGTGTIAGATTINAGGTITGGGGGTVGTLTLQNNLTFIGTSSLTLATYAVDISGATSDKLAITGTLDLSGNFDQITFTGTPDGTSTYVLATAGTLSGTFDFGTAPTGYSFQYSGTELDLVPTPVPEPATCVGGALLVGVAAWKLRQRRLALRTTVGA